MRLRFKKRLSGLVSNMPESTKEEISQLKDRLLEIYSRVKMEVSHRLGISIMKLPRRSTYSMRLPHA